MDENGTLCNSFLCHKFGDDAPELPFFGQLTWDRMKAAHPVVADIIVGLLTEFANGCMQHVIHDLSHGQDGFNELIEHLNMDRVDRNLKPFDLIDGLFIKVDPERGVSHLMRVFPDARKNQAEPE